MSTIKPGPKRSSILLLLCFVITFFSARAFLFMRQEEPIYPGPGVTEIKKLSDYYPPLKGTPVDTDVYILEGENPGSTAFVMGGNHPNEPAAFLASVLLIENVVVEAGRLIVIPRGNNSAFTHTEPQEAYPMRFTFPVEGGERFFRFGSRATNPIHQWPDPDVYIHSSGQQLSGSETRNLNRAFPGREDGNITERLAFGLTTLIQKEGAHISFDLHEASPEYPVVNAIVSHDRGMELASFVTMDLQMKGIPISMEPSPVTLRGLTHREWGDFTDTMPFLLETANPAQGRLRGATNEDLVLTGQDPFYVRARELGRLYVPFDESGHPIEERVARHLVTIQHALESYNFLYFDGPIEVQGIPPYDELIERGVGAFLKPPS